MPPRTTTWPLEPHTRGKHLVLERYMQAWLPIMTKWNERVLFIDAFAGPGEYSGGEPGSPVIALQALIEHRAKNRMQSDINYLFIEVDRDRCQHLTRVLDSLKGQLPPNCSYKVINSTFDKTLTEVLDNVEEQRTLLDPSFVMIDPFGVSGTPMSTISRILDNPKSEVFISLLYREMNRFLGHPSFSQHLDNLFGSTAWREAVGMSDSEFRKKFLFDLYRDQLKVSGAEYVVRFELYEKQEMVYAIFFGTKNLDGCNKMKQAIWKVAPFGDFKFRGSRLGQLTLGEDFVDFSLLENVLQDQFRGKSWQKIEDVDNFVKSDATDFHSGHLKLKTLTPMEKRGTIQAKRPHGSRGFVPGTRIFFL